MSDFGKTAAIVITGNEVLSGKVTEQNAHYLAAELRILGVNLRRISIIPDQVDLIAEEIAFCRSRFDFIFTSGGIGPTHDDLTVEGIAKGLDRKLFVHPVLKETLEKIYGNSDQVNPALMKMTMVPEGTELLYGDHLKTPVLVAENIYIFPGVPDYLRKKFAAISERFRETPFHLTKIFFNQNEEVIAAGLNQTVAQFPRLLIGSYPVLNQLEYQVIVTVESKEGAYLEEGVAVLLSLFPKNIIWKIEKKE